MRREKQNWQIELEKNAKKMSDYSSIPYECCELLLIPGSESDVIPIIKKYLVTPDQRSWLGSEFISIEDMLNGRVEGDDNQTIISRIFAQWNEKLGQKYFG